MRIGSSIGLIALGLILALAINVDLSGIDLSLIGWILTVVGLIGLITSLVLAGQTRPRVARDPYDRPDYPADRDPRY